MRQLQPQATSCFGLPLLVSNPHTATAVAGTSSHGKEHFLLAVQESYLLCHKQAAKGYAKASCRWFDLDKQASKHALG
jgi:hypothetical protein